jgi:hypothetical protein
MAASISRDRLTSVLITCVTATPYHTCKSPAHVGTISSLVASLIDSCGSMDVTAVQEDCRQDDRRGSSKLPMWVVGYPTFTVLVVM